jgi:hypothetical protein
MYARALRNAVHTRRFTIRTVPPLGWEVRDENDGGVLRRVLVSDWHRVERAISNFTKEAETLRAGGWVDDPTN